MRTCGNETNARHRRPFGLDHALAVVVVVAVLAALWGCSRRPESPPPPSDGGFRDALPNSGIQFAMQFLPNEQGETYKVNLYDHGCGIAVADYDGDGNEDVYFLNQMGANALYKGRGDGTFTNVTAEAGVGLGDRICVSAVFADYDNDGRQDLFVTSIRGGNALFHNEGHGKFRDVTETAGVKHVGHSQAALFFDFDGDGFLDLFVTNTAGWTMQQYNEEGRYFTGLSSLEELQHSTIERNVLYRNNRKGGFTDVTAAAGVQGMGWAADATAFDYDGDRQMDLCVTNMFGRSQLYRNGGNGKFTDVTLATLGRTSWGGMGVKVLDFDNDGRLDLFITDMHSDMWMTSDYPASAVEEKKKYSTVKGRMAPPGMAHAGGGSPGSSGGSGGGPPDGHGGAGADGTSNRVSPESGAESGDVVYGNTLFKNEGNGRFIEVSDRAGVETFWPWGVAAGDLNNDGSIDLFVPSGMGYPFFYWRNSLLMNSGSGAFDDRSRREGIDPPPGGENQEQTIAGKPAVRSSRSAVAADFDRDGRLDLMTNNFNGRPYYYRNRFKPRHNLRFSLRGTRSNRDALGAILRLVAGKTQLVQTVEGAGGYLSCPSKIVHFGLGDITSVDRVEILWPSGTCQTVTSPKVDTLIEVEESSKR